MSLISRLMMLGIGAFFAGIFLGLKDLGPWLDAKRTGVITRRGYAAAKIKRDEEPDRFRTLVASRGRGVAFGFGLSAAGAVTAVVCAFLVFGMTHVSSY